MSKVKIGDRFGRLVIVDRKVHRHRYGEKNDYTWVCKCDCGQTREVRTHSFTRTKYPTKSCGCWRDEHLSRRHTEATKPHGEAAFNRVYSQYRMNARNAGVLFALSEAEFRKIVTQNCSYCGTPPARIKRTPGGTFVCNGVDRIEPAKGYAAGNVNPCCQSCNIAKHDMLPEQFAAWVSRVYTWWACKTTVPVQP